MARADKLHKDSQACLMLTLKCSPSQFKTSRYPRLSEEPLSPQWTVRRSIVVRASRSQEKQISHRNCPSMLKTINDLVSRSGERQDTTSATVSSCSHFPLLNFLDTPYQGSGGVPERWLKSWKPANSLISRESGYKRHGIARGVQ